MNAYSVKRAAFALFLIILLIGAFSCSTKAPTGARSKESMDLFEKSGGCLPRDCFSAAVEKRTEGRPLEAAYRLGSLRRQFPGTLWAARASFLLGVSALETAPAQTWQAQSIVPRPHKVDTQAIKYFREALALKGIEDYVKFYHAGALRAADRLDEAVDEYDSLIIDHPGSVLIPRVLFEKAYTLAVANRHAEAIGVLDGLVGAYPAFRLIPEALLLKAHLSWAEARFKETAWALKEIITRYPTHIASSDAADFIRLLKLNDVEVPDLIPKEMYTRGRAFFREARYEEAIEGFLAALDGAAGEDGEGGGNWYREDDTAGAALFGAVSIDLAIARLRLKRYSEAEDGLKKYLEAAPEGGSRTKALYWLAFSAFRRNDPGLLKEVEGMLDEEDPGGRSMAWVLVYTAELLEKGGEHTKARELYDRVAREFSGQVAAEAAWRLGWASYRSESYQEALNHFLAFLSSDKKVPKADKFYYWSAKSAERLEMEALAGELYLRTCTDSVHTYYCQMATDRMALLEVKAPFKGKGRMVEPVASSGGTEWTGRLAAFINTGGDKKANLKYEPRVLAAKELITLGLKTEASAELDLVIEWYSTSRAALIELASLFYEAGDFYRGLMVYYRNLPVIMDESPYLPGELLDIVFPLEVVEMVRSVAPAGPADAYLVAAVMREESTFNPDAVSKAGARGLMQIMPQTGDYIARKTGNGTIKPDELMDPARNIRFGSWYLAYLAGRFNNDLVYTIAGYNAGPTAVRRWVKPGPYEPDEFIEMIPYEETRTYTKRVIQSYTEFLKVAGHDPGTRFERPLVVRGTERSRGALKGRKKDRDAG
jgi:soluble lytic murein transglycosylase